MRVTELLFDQTSAPNAAIDSGNALINADKFDSVSVIMIPIGGNFAAIAYALYLLNEFGVITYPVINQPHAANSNPETAVFGVMAPSAILSNVVASYCAPMPPKSRFFIQAQGVGVQVRMIIFGSRTVNP